MISELWKKLDIQIITCRNDVFLIVLYRFDPAFQVDIFDSEDTKKLTQELHDKCEQFRKKLGDSEIKTKDLLTVIRRKLRNIDRKCSSIRFELSIKEGKLRRRRDD